MNLPNKLTMMRIILIPIMIILFYIPWLNDNYLFKYNVTKGLETKTYGLTWLYFFELIIFFLASITDFLDGKIARKKEMVTSFGKFADPLADKMLVFAAMAILMLDNRGLVPKGPLIPMWLFIVILIRELTVSGIRMLAAKEKGEVMAAKMLGKIKTFSTMVGIIILFLSGVHPAFIYVGQITMYVAGLFTIISGIDYFIKSKDVILASI